MNIGHSFFLLRLKKENKVYRNCQNFSSAMKETKMFFVFSENNVFLQTNLLLSFLKK